MNLNTGSMDGRIDMTEIGRSQLTALINVMDPKYESQQMNRARLALGIAYPSFVQMAFQKGYMDFNMKLIGPIHYEFQLNGIPISPWISNATAELNKNTKKESLQ